MLLINRLTVPGGIKRVELRPDTVRVVLRDGTEKVYTNNRDAEIDLADPGALDAVADRMER